MVHVNNLSYQYKNGNRVLNGLKFSIKKGEFVAVIGQNGAGKTTLLKQLNGLLKPSQGSVLIDGMDVQRTKTSVLSRHIGFLFQNPDHQIFCQTVYDEIAFGLKNMGLKNVDIEEAVNESAQKVGIDRYLASNPFSLSKGQRQRVALASVLALKTDILVLDEPTTGQDYREGIEIMDIIRDLNNDGKTIIMVTHDMELVSRYAKRAIILCNGEILEDGPTEKVLSKTESIALSNLQAPQIYELARKFHKQRLFKNVFSPEEMLNEILSYLEDDANASNG